MTSQNIPNNVDIMYYDDLLNMLDLDDIDLGDLEDIDIDELIQEIIRQEEAMGFFG